MKIFLASLATEANTFSPMPTGLQDFDLVRAADYTVEKADMAYFHSRWRTASLGGMCHTDRKKYG